MGELRYMISEAAKQVDVESHVLRYWEDELDLNIERTEMGHRYYTQDNIELFQCIKKLKENGMQLKDLKPMIPELIEKKKKVRQAVQNEEVDKKEELDKQEVSISSKENLVFNDEKLEQVKVFVSDIVSEVLQDNNEKLKKEITESVTEEVSREFNQVMRDKERQEEEHFHKMDCLIRQQQVYRKGVGKTAAIQKIKKLVMGM